MSTFTDPYLSLPIVYDAHSKRPRRVLPRNLQPYTWPSSTPRKPAVENIHVAALCVLTWSNMSPVMKDR